MGDYVVITGDPGSGRTRLLESVANAPVRGWWCGAPASRTGKQEADEPSMVIRTMDWTNKKKKNLVKLNHTDRQSQNYLSEAAVVCVLYDAFAGEQAARRAVDIVSAIENQNATRALIGTYYYKTGEDRGCADAQEDLLFEKLSVANEMAMNAMSKRTHIYLVNLFNPQKSFECISDLISTSEFHSSYQSFVSVDDDDDQVEEVEESTIPAPRRDGGWRRRFCGCLSRSRYQSVPE